MLTFIQYIHVHEKITLLFDWNIYDWLKTHIKATAGAIDHLLFRVCTWKAASSMTDVQSFYLNVFLHMMYKGAIPAKTFNSESKLQNSNLITGTCKASGC